MMLFGDYVLDLKTQEWIIGLMQLAVFAAFAGSQTHQRADGSLHAGWPFRAKRMRAWALRMATKWLAMTYISYSCRSSGVSSPSLHLVASLATRACALRSALSATSFCAASKFRDALTGSR